MAYLNSNIPVIDAYIRNEYLYNHTMGHGSVTKCNIHTVSSIESMTPLFETLLHNGVNWTRRPITAFCWKKDAPILPLNEHVYWDCFTYYVDVQIRHRLQGLSADLISISGKKYNGEYLFTIDWAHENNMMTNVSFGETPEHKCAHFFKVDDGNFFLYPNNKIIWKDKSFTEDRIKSNPGYLIDNSTYRVENGFYYESDDNFITNFNEITPD